MTTMNVTAQAAKLVAPELAQRGVAAHVFVLRGARDGDPLCKASASQFERWYPGRATTARRAMKAEDADGRQRLRQALDGDGRAWAAFAQANQQAAQQVVEAAQREVVEARGNGQVGKAAKAEAKRIRQAAKVEAAWIAKSRRAAKPKLRLVAPAEPAGPVMQGPYRDRSAAEAGPYRAHKVAETARAGQVAMWRENLTSPDPAVSQLAYTELFKMSGGGGLDPDAVEGLRYLMDHDPDPAVHLDARRRLEQAAGGRA